MGLASPMNECLRKSYLHCLQTESYCWFFHEVSLIHGCLSLCHLGEGGEEGEKEEMGGGGKGGYGMFELKKFIHFEPRIQNVLNPARRKIQ